MAIIKDIKLNYLKDCEGNYILKNVVNDNEFTGEVIVTNGDAVENWVISNKFFDRKLQHKLDDAVTDIEHTVLLKNRIKPDDIISEKIIVTVTPEIEFNPLFKAMSDKEILTYTRHSTKVKVHISFVFHIKQQSHLWIKTHLDSLKDFFNFLK